MSKGTLFDRLLEICRDSGVERPTGRDIEALTGLTSGRVTQIKQAGEAGRLGADALQRVLKKGYSTEWVVSGRGGKHQHQTPPADPASATAEMVLRAVGAVLESHGLDLSALVQDEGDALRRLKREMSGASGRRAPGRVRGVETDNLSAPRRGGRGIKEA